jgi:hypothetical protein
MSTLKSDKASDTGSSSQSRSVVILVALIGAASVIIAALIPVIAATIGHNGSKQANAHGQTAPLASPSSAVSSHHLHGIATKESSRHGVSSEVSNPPTGQSHIPTGTSSTRSAPPRKIRHVSETYRETVGGNTSTWTDYSNAGGTAGVTISAYVTVHVDCRVQGFKVQDGDTWWYRIGSSPWNGAFYASADAFYNNGSTSGVLMKTPYVDTKVPRC